MKSRKKHFAMTRNDVYVDLRGNEIPLGGLDSEEHELVRALQHRAETRPDWIDFGNYWVGAVADLYDGRGVPRSRSRRTAVFRIAQDLSGRLAIAAGMARPPDYRDELEEIIRTRFKTRREFCRATGVSEDMLSHVLARRKHMSIDTLVHALDHVGYELRIAPRANTSPSDPNGEGARKPRHVSGAD
jgi:hypothetical protein